MASQIFSRPFTRNIPWELYCSYGCAPQATRILIEGPTMKTSRRDFLIGTSAVAGSSLVVPFSALAQQKAPKKAPKKKEEEEEEEDVSTNEDLMREHGVLNRVLLIYDEALRRIQAKEKFDPAVLVKSAGIIKSFIEDYQEKLEEDHIFPRFEQSGSKLTELTVNLRAQHAVGRILTEKIAATAKSGDTK